MSLYVEEKTASSVPPLAEDTYPAVCYALVDLGEQFSAVYEKYTKKIAIGWELPGETITIDGETVPRTFFNTYTASLSTKSLLRKDLTSWRGKEFTVEELKGFNLRNIVGVPCMIQIVHRKSADGSRTYANLASVTKIPKGFPAPKGKLEPMIYDIEEDDPAVVDTLPQWMQDKIKESRSFQFHLEQLKNEGKPKFEELDDDEDGGTLPF